MSCILTESPETLFANSPGKLTVINVFLMHKNKMCIRTILLSMPDWQQLHINLVIEVNKLNIFHFNLLMFTK